MDFDAPRTPCSVAEHDAVDRIAKHLSSLGFESVVERFRSPTSPIWTPLLATLLRIASAATLLLGIPRVAFGCATGALLVLVAPRPIARALATIPGVGGRSANAVATVPPASRTTDPPLVVVAHVDTHGPRGRRLRGAHAAVVRLSTLVVFAGAAYAAFADASLPVIVPMLIGVEAVATTARLFATNPHEERGDNASGIQALLRTAELLAAEPPLRGVWLVATGAATTGGEGMLAFLARHRRAARVAWVVELEGLGTGELVVTPVRRRIPRAETPPAVLRAVAGAAIDTGDPIDIRRRARPHSDAVVAFSRGAPALAITGGVAPPGDDRPGDEASAERAARIVERIARTSL